MNLFQRGGRRGGCVGCVVAPIMMILVLGCVGAVFWGVMSLLRNSEPFEMAMALVNEDETAVALLGEPIEPGWLVTGSIQTSGSSGTADFSIPISGPENDGQLYVTAIRFAGEWEFGEVILEVNGERRSLLSGR